MGWIGKLEMSFSTSRAGKRDMSFPTGLAKKKGEGEKTNNIAGQSGPKKQSLQRRKKEQECIGFR